MTHVGPRSKELYCAGVIGRNGTFRMPNNVDRMRLDAFRAVQAFAKRDGRKQSDSALELKPNVTIFKLCRPQERLKWLPRLVLKGRRHL